MAKTRAWFSVTPERVFSVLADPEAYADWVAIVRLELVPHDGGTLVTITEIAGDPLSRLALNPLTYPLVNRRNDESLRRLRRIAETGVLKT